MDISAWMSLAALVFAIGTLAFSLRSTPARIERQLRETFRQMQELQDDVAAVRTSWTSYREAIDGVLDEITAGAERAERHSRTVKQRERRKAEKENAAPAEPVDEHMALLNKARRMGLPV